MVNNVEIFRQISHSQNIYISDEKLFVDWVKRSETQQMLRRKPQIFQLQKYFNSNSEIQPEIILPIERCSRNIMI